MFFFFEQVSLLGGADESVKMSTSPTLLLDTRSAAHSTTTAPEATTEAAGPLQTAAVETIADSPDDDRDEDEDDDGDEDESVEEREIAAAVAAGEREDVTAERSAPVVAVAAGLGHAEWQLLAAAGAGVAVFLSLALALAYRNTFCGSPALRKAVRDGGAECPPLLDCAPRPLDFTKYFGEFDLQWLEP